MSYRLRITDTADANADAIADWLAMNVSVEYAARWYDALLAAVDTLREFPRMNVIAPEQENYDAEVRRMLYYGPSGRSGGAAYRVIYAVRDEVDEDGFDGTVDVLNIIHSARPA